jgi:hypothetical protein
VVQGGGHPFDHPRIALTENSGDAAHRQATAKVSRTM